MTYTHDSNDEVRHPYSSMQFTARQRRVVLRITLAVLAVMTLLALPFGGAGVTSAQENNSTTTATLNETAPYYVNETTIGNQSGWFPNGSNVSVDTLGQMTMRIGPFIIGTGDQIPGGTTYAGTIITGLAVVAAFVGALSYTSVGSQGGIVVAATVGYGLTSIGLAPPWLKIVFIMMVGSIAAIAALRVTN